MSVTDWIEAPVADDVPLGKNSLERIWRLGANVAAPLTPGNVKGVQNVSASPLTPATTKQIYQHASGDEYFEMKTSFTYQVTMDVLAGKVFDFMGQIYGDTYGAAGYYGLATRAETIPVVTMESIIRDTSGNPLFTRVYPEMILREWEENNPMEDNPSSFTFWGSMDTFRIYTGAELVIDRFTADGSSGDFTLSATPVHLFDITHDRNQKFLLNNIVSVISKTTAQSYGARLRGGVSVVGETLSITPVPAASTVITVTYAKATA